MKYNAPLGTNNPTLQKTVPRYSWVKAAGAGSSPNPEELLPDRHAQSQSGAGKTERQNLPSKTTVVKTAGAA
jgi:hypothetical protein